ncbi:hypothetical protein [Bacillus sp. Marseille-Q3570]|uniref:hypothetical protein n=1 Tax=Bacillus sp. Marseille-Q3570 TaxID=2963522 RepID=UPI0021B83BAB|nr:hypothetical protein [Bacillus sp. Marseille-Q3570]
MWMMVLIPLLIVLFVAIYYEYTNKKKADLHLNSREHQERPSQAKMDETQHRHSGGEGSEPPPT